MSVIVSVKVWRFIYVATLLYSLVLISLLAGFYLERFKLRLPSLARSPDSTAAVAPLALDKSELVPHFAYFDHRQQRSHTNATVIFISILEVYRDNVVGCKIDDVLQTEIRVSDIVLYTWVKRYLSLSHRDCFVFCYDMDIEESSLVSILYDRNGTSLEVPVASDVVYPNYDSEEDAVMLCAVGFGSVPHLDQWLLYQQTIGMKFIHLNVEPSFLVNFKTSSLLQKFIDSSFVGMTVWNMTLSKKHVFYHSQSLKCHDCILRYQGRYKYVMVMDFDEYFIPLGSHKDVHFYVKNLFKETTGSVYLSRHEYYCRTGNGTNEALVADGNVTRLYSTEVSAHKNEGKSVHLMKAVEQTSVHRVGGLLSPYQTLVFNDSPKHTHCYIAHITEAKLEEDPRFKRLPRNQCKQ